MSAKTKSSTATETVVENYVKQASDAGKEPANVMYLGPTITGVVRHSTVFKNGVYPKKLNECMEQFPAMKRLFVAMGDISSAAKELKAEQSALKSIYSQVEKKFK